MTTLMAGMLACALLLPHATARADNDPVFGGGKSRAVAKTPPRSERAVQSRSGAAPAAQVPQSDAQASAPRLTPPPPAPEPEPAHAVATAGPAGDPASARPIIRPEYKVDAGDRLKVVVYNSDKLSGEYAVGGDGKIAMPMLGRVAVAGLSLDGVTQAITARLSDGFFQNPNVSVDIAAYRSVYILGEVEKPGQYPFVEGMTVYQLVAQAGGFTYRANRKTIRLRHETDPVERKYSVSSASPVRAGDTIVILQRYF